jgi:hypothetical protein
MGRDRAAEAAGLPALGDDRVGAGIGGPFGLLDRVHLLNERAAGGVRPVHEVLPHPQGDRDHGRCKPSVSA